MHGLAMVTGKYRDEMLEITNLLKMITFVVMKISLRFRGLSVPENLCWRASPIATSFPYINAVSIRR